jgi:hypothetical protein
MKNEKAFSVSGGRQDLKHECDFQVLRKYLTTFDNRWSTSGSDKNGCRDLLYIAVFLVVSRLFFTNTRGIVRDKKRHSESSNIRGCIFLAI